MGTFADELASGTAGHWGLGAVLIPVVLDTFGNTGVGVVLATNFVLEVHDQFGRPVDAGTAYTLSYYNPATGQQVALPLVHDPSTPYQANLPENQAIVFSLAPGSRYADGQTAQTTISPNGFGKMAVALAYPAGTVYARRIQKQYR